MAALSFLLRLEDQPIGGVFGLITLNPLSEKYYAKSTKAIENQVATPLLIYNGKKDDILDNADS